MINWEIINYPVTRAEVRFDAMKPEKFKDIQVDESFVELRNKLIEARDDIFDEDNLDITGELKYDFDLKFGLALYQILNEDKNFDLRIAANDDVWRYISVEIIPDIVHSRWGHHEERSYKNARRIWPKTLWWYIHLGWIGSTEETFAILNKHTTDTLMNLVERPGLGYNVELYREILKQSAEVTVDPRGVFRRMMVLNTARLENVAPELVDGGIEQYVADLIKAVQ